jgi:hypothetical protein
MLSVICSYFLLHDSIKRLFFQKQILHEVTYVIEFFKIYLIRI